jgi:hypothetical protein
VFLGSCHQAGGCWLVGLGGAGSTEITATLSPAADHRLVR